MSASDPFPLPITFENPTQMIDAVKRETPRGAEECMGYRLRSRKSFASRDTAENIEESHGARLAGYLVQYRVTWE